ncbi:MAG: PaaI family thioesterase [Proteobacteria bacterium]|nr:MAG: PaaI family thioesterase [Pseudomonadota bacterium]
MKIIDWLRSYLDGSIDTNQKMRMEYPPAIARTLGFDLVAIGDATATLVMETDPSKHANPMGTIHGGVLCDLADAAIGTAHSTTLEENESFTSIDLRINFFRPIWKEKITATAKVVQLGKTVSYYTCDITKADGKLVATVTSSVMTLQGNKGSGR